MVNRFDHKPRRGFNTQGAGVYHQVVVEGIRPVDIMETFEVFCRGPVVFKGSILGRGKGNLLPRLQATASNFQWGFDTHVEDVGFVFENCLTTPTQDHHITVPVSGLDGTLDQGNALLLI
jgi:hypothetical protein